MGDEQLSQAILEYLRVGRSAAPASSPDAVVAFASSVGVDPAVLLARVVAITEECMAVTIDWSTRTLSQGGDEARQAMAQRHPELSSAALDALRRMFTYNWR